MSFQNIIILTLVKFCVKWYYLVFMGILHISSLVLKLKVFQRPGQTVDPSIILTSIFFGLTSEGFKKNKGPHNNKTKPNKTIIDTHATSVRTGE